MGASLQRNRPDLNALYQAPGEHEINDRLEPDP
jgi:hypothetical protein